MREDQVNAMTWYRFHTKICHVSFLVSAATTLQAITLRPTYLLTVVYGSMIAIELRALMIDRTVELMERLLMVALQNANDLFMRMPRCVEEDIQRNK